MESFGKLNKDCRQRIEPLTSKTQRSTDIEQKAQLSDLVGIMWTVVLWVVTSCILVRGYECFGEISPTLSAQKMEALRFSETLVSSYLEAAKSHNPHHYIYTFTVVRTSDLMPTYRPTDSEISSHCRLYCTNTHDP
jgi:hypothetical protein